MEDDEDFSEDDYDFSEQEEDVDYEDRKDYYADQWRGVEHLSRYNLEKHGRFQGRD